MSEVKSYRDLLVWQKAMDLAVATYEATRGFPREEMFGLTAQSRRASASVPANIAEGYGRSSTQAYANFLRIAQGSLKELETHVILAERVGLLSGPKAAPVLAQADEVGRMLRALIAKLQTPRD